MRRHPLDSSSLASVGYDPRRHRLEVEFRTGHAYDYFDVRPSVYDELRQAPSAGRFFRSTIRKYPSSSTLAMSPVSSHRVPSSAALIIPAISSGRLKYPCMTWGPEMISSPSWPGSTSLVQSSRSTMRQSVSGTGIPMVPNFRLP